VPFVWKEKYRLGINEIDRQHQTFLLLLNKAFDFYSHAAKNLPPDEVRQRVLKDLAGITDFARAHFTTEESLMTRHDYPKLAEHRQEHAKLLDIAAFFQEKTSQPGTFTSMEWIKVILQWYDHHVQHIDREMGEFLNAAISSEAGLAPQG
jgi:hemerythrin